MKIKLYGLPTCCRCTTAKMMLEKRNLPFDYYTFWNSELTIELPMLTVDDKTYYGKEALLFIRTLK